MTIAVFAMGMSFNGASNEPPQSNTAQKREKAEKAKIDESSFWEWVANDAAGFFTFLLVIVGIGQAGLFFWQLRYMRAGMRDAKIAANAAQKSAGTAEAAFVKLERPYIYVFGAIGPRTDFNCGESPLFELEYSVANYGKTPAKLSFVYVGVSVGSVPAEPFLVQNWHELKESPILIAGERRNGIDHLIQEEISFVETSGEFAPPHFVPKTTDKELFFFSVKIIYEGPFSVGHETSACWVWDADSERLILYGEDKYNYTN